jgi:hypothetical protein
VTVDWRKLHSEDFIRMIKTWMTTWTGHVARMGEKCIQNTGKKGGGRPLGISRRRWLIILKKIFNKSKGLL